MIRYFIDFNCHKSINNNKMDSETEQKQKYLRQNILERQYDAQQFMDFCQSYKGSIDIESWTLQELKDIVQSFISTNSKTLQLSPFQYNITNNTNSQVLQNFDWDNAFEKPLQMRQEEQAINLNLVDLDFLQTMGMSSAKPVKKQIKHPPINNKQTFSTDPKEILAKINDKNNNFISAYNANAMNNLNMENKASKKEIQSPKEQKNQIIDLNPNILAPQYKESFLVEQNFKGVIKCKSFSNKPRLDADYQIVVSGHEIVNPNPFVPNYVLYSITTNPLNKEVKRRLKDFQTLRALLVKIFPTTQIPFLERCGRLSETEPSVIKKQKLFLQSFLNNLLMNKNIRCKIIDDFLLCQSLDLLKKIYRDFEKLEKPKGIQDLYTPEGKLQLQYNSMNRKILSQNQIYLQFLQPNFMKLKELYDQLLISFASNIKIMGEISDLYDSIRTSTKNVNNSLPEEFRNIQFQNSLEKVSELHKHWSLSIKTQAKIMEVQTRHMYRFQYDNLQTIIQLCKQADSVTETFAKRSDKEAANKDQYEYNKKLNEYKVGVDSPSKNTVVLKHQAAYILKNSLTEVSRFFDELSQKIIKNFKNFSILQLSISNDLSYHWRQFQKIPL